MFLENLNLSGKQSGWIEVITGSMFSGKTEELIRRLRRAIIANQHVQIFKPKIDGRYDSKKIVSHNKETIESVSVNAAHEILNLADRKGVIGIDEAQFFDKEIVECCHLLANSGNRVIIAGLDMDFKGEPFGYVPQLIAMAEYVTKVHAICVGCGKLAHYSYRKSDEERLVVIGEYDIYEPLCRNCFNLKSKK